MKLRISDLKNKHIWQNKGYELPDFDIEKVKENTLKAPIWLHFGAGNIFRAFPAALQQTLLNEGLSDKGIIVCESYDEEIIEKAYVPFDNLSLLVTLKADGTVDKKIIASIIHAMVAEDSMEELEKIFISPTLQMVSFTITEKGYSLTDSKGNYYQDILEDLNIFPQNPKTLMGTVTYLCYKRYLAGKLPIALVSMDNCSHNGSKLYSAVKTFADNWVKKGQIDKGFSDYISNSKFVSFPWTMIDKITPRPSKQVKAMLEADGFEDAEIIATAKHTYISSFVNAEQTQYLVIEEAFPNSRPPLEKAGAIFTDRQTVDKVEKMKVCTCLNPLHTILAIYGCLLGYNSIAEEMKDKHLKTFIEKAGYEEGLPVVVNPGIIKPEEFLREVIEERFPNPFVPDTPQRIACDTSQKIPVRFGETLKAYISTGKRDISTLTYIPLFFAGWLRYLMGIDDEGKPFAPSPDPMLEVLQGYIKDISLGDKGPFTDSLKPILSNSSIFGINLYEYNLASKIENMFTELVAGKGAVRKTLEKYLD
ncbi:Mannitol 2-dehydrogenase [Tepidanaerobacter acetatoxydans Re1]|uniref:Mannitol 2-dehydrogenase n=1 Tax=Tepidanaerobacter acetatoxydans (strain DSM 21804 / JCM 16047 / Re1) TaxID=1209989 RepID=F4LX88_TEPAE|nr:mannitol dehydrogenase family protein [Tepidanaerobacter acetatoxydans]AEE91887.1 Mannitol 2-dehydrogenase [Tepidanaerobacter acetatoxydans Re1]CCP26703.1 Mannitol 2-dehydrogenase [Tepidanaerobacter acetatoxydans Re1]